jgi:polar amino acid transport system substrate-binding protein
MRTRALVVGTAAIFAAVAVGGCAGTSDRTLKTTLTALRAEAPAPPPSPKSPIVKCKDSTASLRPPAQLPQPGHMPPGSFMETIYRHGRLVAGVNQNFLRFAYLNPRNGRIEGFEVDIVREIAKAIFGKPSAVALKALTVTQRIPYVRKGSVDIVVDNVTIACDRRKLVDFSSVYYDAGQRVLVRSDSNARSLHDLVGKRVCAADGSTPLKVIQRYRPRLIAESRPQSIDCLVALEQGAIDAISTDDSILQGFKAQDPYTKVVGPRIVAAPYGIAIKKSHPEFVRFVNGVLARMRADGTWARLYAKWLGRPIPPPPQARYHG